MYEIRSSSLGRMRQRGERTVRRKQASLRPPLNRGCGSIDHRRYATSDSLIQALRESSADKASYCHTGHQSTSILSLQPHRRTATTDLRTAWAPRPGLHWPPLLLCHFTPTRVLASEEPMTTVGSVFGNLGMRENRCSVCCSATNTATIHTHIHTTIINNNNRFNPYSAFENTQFSFEIGLIKRERVGLHDYGHYDHHDDFYQLNLQLLITIIHYQ